MVQDTVMTLHARNVVSGLTRERHMNAFPWHAYSQAFLG